MRIHVSSARVGLVCLALLAAGCGPGNLRHATLPDAVEHGDCGDARRHVSRGADVNESGREGWTPLMVAAYRGDRAMIRLLADHGARVNAANADGATPLMIALYNDHPQAVRALLDRGADVHARTQAGRTPLMIAVRKGNLRMIEFLVERGADVEARDDHGRTVLEQIEWLEQRTGLMRPDLYALLIRCGAQAPTAAMKTPG